MSLSKRFGEKTKPAPETGDFSCPDYEPLSGSKRCRFYMDGGSCSRPDQFMCVEWLRANGELVEPTVIPEQEPSPQAKPESRDLFGNPVPPPPQRPPSSASLPPVAQSRVDQEDAHITEPLRGLTTEDIDSFKALNVEVCLASARFGEVWLVPEYTGQDRRELTPEHAATICQVLSAFPGSTVIAFEKNPTPHEEESAP